MIELSKELIDKTVDELFSLQETEPTETNPPGEKRSVLGYVMDEISKFEEIYPKKKITIMMGSRLYKELLKERRGYISGFTIDSHYDTSTQPFPELTVAGFPVQLYEGLGDKIYIIDNEGIPQPSMPHG